MHARVIKLLGRIGFTNFGINSIEVIAKCHFEEGKTEKPQKGPPSY
ncbi:hypothetical protein LV83_03656 [Algoriphagus yeomjeoni]|uniref:Uncharacterized protein n=1 Tax=Algoriphagus yeomjeoni TaxID=291403 RepID=A0A327P6M1_9BACT|nr:hypothetical protein LV83_03656 [Algoriphagus yeomjeoni]